VFLIAFGIIIPKKKENGNPPYPLFFLFFGLLQGPKQALSGLSSMALFAPECLNMRKIVYFYEISLDIDFQSQYII